MKKLKEYVKSISDFPKPGIIFRGVTSILQDMGELHLAVDSPIHMVEDPDYDVVIGPEPRGSIFGVPVAYAQHKSFVLVRKQGKLPCETIPIGYELEYGAAIVEIHKDTTRPGQRMIIVDNLIATGGTTEAIVKLIGQLEGVVMKICFVMELAGLNGREHLKGYDVDSAIICEGEQISVCGYLQII